MTDLQATLDAIEQLAVQECGHCSRRLRPDGPSVDFCDHDLVTRFRPRLLAEVVDIPAPIMLEVRMWRVGVESKSNRWVAGDSWAEYPPAGQEWRAR